MPDRVMDGSLRPRRLSWTMLLRFARRCTAHPEQARRRGAPLLESAVLTSAAVLSIVDARTLKAGLQTDLCVIGAGAAGIACHRAHAGGREVLLKAATSPPITTQCLHDLASIGYPPRELHVARALFRRLVQSLGGPQHAALEFDVAHVRGCRTAAGRSAMRSWRVTIREPPRCCACQAVVPIGAQRMSWATPARRRSPDAGDGFAVGAADALRRGVSAGAGAGDARSHQQNLTHIHLNEAGDRVEALSVATLSGQRFTVRARTVVLACGGSRTPGCSSPRATASLALAIASIRWGATSWNIRAPCSARCACGRDAGCPCCGFPLTDGKVQVGLGLSEQTQRRERLLNHYLTLEAEVSATPSRATNRRWRS